MNKFLKSDKIYLKKIHFDDDLANYLDMVNDVEELKHIDELGRYPLNKSDLQEYIKSVNGLFLSIYDNNNEHIGNIRVSDIHPINRHCSFGILLNKKFRNKGYAKEASRLVIEHLFKSLNINRVELYVAKNNLVAIKLYESLGFKFEGCKREAMWIDGQYEDLLIYSKLFKDIQGK
ncbi:MAG: GNAT family N-acetyltransferase [Campylobacterales bacterium]|nr:GNAT family N-acetyltransferase [Campylobacterales bacterium]